MRRILVLAALLAAALVAPSTGAAITIGQGGQPSVAVDAAGTAYVAWAGVGSPRALRFCRLPRGASACDRGAASAIAAPGNSTSVSRPIVLVSGSRVVVLQYRFGADVPNGFGLLNFISTDGGRTFGPGEVVGSVLVNEAVAGPGDTLSAASRFTPALTPGLPAGSVTFQNVALTGAGGGTLPTILAPGPATDGAVGLVDAGTPLAVYVRTDVIPNVTEFRRYSGAGDLNDQASWTSPVGLGPLQRPVLAGGRKGLFLLGTARGSKISVRRFTGSGFSRPVTLGTGFAGHLVQNAAGRLHAAWGYHDANGMLQLAYGTSDNGTDWRVRNLVTVGRTSQLVASARVAAAGDHVVIAWQIGTQVRVDRATPERAGARRRPSLSGFASARPSGVVVHLSVSGTVAAPPGVPRAGACTGTVKLSVVRGGSVLASRTVPVRRTCEFSLRIDAPAALVAGAGHRVRFAFAGNRLLTPVTIERPLSRD
jgi:hypothetical protein